MNYKEFANKLDTISGITVTPFKEGTKEVDWEGVRENVEYLLEKGVKVIVPCGNTSEFYALTLDEVKEEILRTVEIVNGRATVLAGVGYAVDTAIELGQYAKDVGADAIMIHMPIHPYIKTKGTKQYFEAIIQAVDLPSVIYFKDPNISDSILTDLASQERLVGVKYAVNDLPRFAKAVKAMPEEHNVKMICGTAEKWAPFFYYAGATGFTSGLVNVFPEKSFEMLDALQKGDDATVWRVWHEIVQFEDLRAKYNTGNNVVVVKEAMQLLGMNAGVTREPVEALNDEDRKATVELLKSWGFTPNEQAVQI